MEKQKGFSLMGLIVTMIFLGIIGIYGFKIGVIYMNKSGVQNLVKNTLAEAKLSDSSNITTIKNTLSSVLSAGYVEISPNDVAIFKEGDGFRVEVDFERKVEITSEITLVVDLSFEERTM